MFVLSQRAKHAGWRGKRGWAWPQEVAVRAVSGCESPGEGGQDSGE